MLLDTLLWLIVQALATHCSKITDSELLQQSGQAILQILRACHESASNLDDRSLAPKLYVAGFRALNSILAALRAQHGMSTAELVDLLRHFFTYGNELDASTSGAQTELAATALATTFGSRSVQDIGPAGKGAYRPPHARRRSSSSTGWNDDVSTASQSGSESDTGSDSDSSRSSRASSQTRASAVRLAALTCLQQLAKADCRALHPFWIVLLPVYNPLQTKYHAATLMDAIVRDPLPKVRALAAAVLSSMLEGPAQKAYIIIAEAKSAARPPVRGFTTLSSTLGHLVIALHDGLLHAISNESQVPALMNMLKALGTLMLSAAYTRLPSDMLIRCIEALSRRLQSAPQKLTAASADVQAVQSAACACLAAAFGTKAAHPSVSSWLGAQSTGTSTAGQGSLLTTLLDYSLTEGAGSVVLRTEALSALCGLAKNYTAALTLHWAAISHAVARNLQTKKPQNIEKSGSEPMAPRTASSPPETAPNAEAKCAQQAVRLLSEYLSSCHRQSSANKSTSASMDVVSSAGGSEDTRRSSERPTPKQKQVSSQAEPGLSSQSVLSASGAAESRVDEQQCTVMWAEACDEHFPQAVAHSSPSVRSAAQASLADLPCIILQSLTLAQQARVWQWVWHACQHDEAAAVRAAAAKCLGYVAGSVPVQDCQSDVCRSIGVLCIAIGDSTLSVRVSSASAAANVADALQQQQQQLDPQMTAPLLELAKAAMTACQDSDKVQVNGIRAIGNLLAIQQIPSAVFTASHAINSCTHWWGEAWLDQGISCLHTSLASSTEKVQWNACYATGNLLNNDAAAALAAKRRQLQSLLSVLLALVRDSPNYKIRSHAAAALVSLGQRYLYEGLWEVALGIFCEAAADLEGNGSPLDRDTTESGKNYQFKEMLQQQLKAGMQALMTSATPADKSTAMYSTSSQVLQNLLLTSSTLQ
ncbi:TPA: hypothetical protein ACH3X3_011813 [Trebouxia sp. C0006]